MLATPWTSAADFKQRLLDYPQTCVLAAFMRDSSEGRVYLDKDGRPGVAYELNARDRRLMVEVKRSQLCSPFLTAGPGLIRIPDTS